MSPPNPKLQEGEQSEATKAMNRERFGDGQISEEGRQVAHLGRTEVRPEDAIHPGQPSKLSDSADGSITASASEGSMTEDTS